MGDRRGQRQARFTDRLYRSGPRRKRPGVRQQGQENSRKQDRTGHFEASEPDDNGGVSFGEGGHDAKYGRVHSSGQEGGNRE